jgi:hypothetical protein
VRLKVCQQAVPVEASTRATFIYALNDPASTVASVANLLDFKIYVVMTIEHDEGECRSPETLL